MARSSDACGTTVGDRMDTVVRVMRELETREHDTPHPNDWWFYNTSDFYLRNCSRPDAAFTPLDTMIHEARIFATVMHELPPPMSKCDSKALDHAVLEMMGTVAWVEEVVGGRSACGGNTSGNVIYDHAVRTADALCTDLAQGFTQLFFWQACAGGVLLLLSATMPGLWHSHHLPPPSIPSRRYVRRTLLRWSRCTCELPRALRQFRTRARRPGQGADTAPMLADTDVHAPMLPSSAADSTEAHSLPVPDAPGSTDAGVDMANAPAAAPASVDPLAPRISSAEAAAAEVAAEFSASLGRASPQPTLTTEPLIARTERQDTTCSNHEAL